jgi:hypothetical protein
MSTKCEYFGPKKALLASNIRRIGSRWRMRKNASFRLVVRFARRNTLFYDEVVTALPGLVSTVYVGDEAMEMSRYGQHDARRRLVRFAMELRDLYFQTAPQNLAEVELLT